MKLPPASGAHGSDTQKAQALARYLTVKHIVCDHKAGAVLGISGGSVRTYRSQYHATRPEGWLLRRQKVSAPVEPPKPQRASGGAKNAVLEYSAENGRTNRVSLPAVPFDIPHEVRTSPPQKGPMA